MGEQLPNREMPDGTPCWCVAESPPQDGWVHSPRCFTMRGLTGGFDFGGGKPNQMRDTEQPPKVVTQRAKKALFLRAFRLEGIMTPAADAAGVHPTTVGRWRAEDPAFAREYEVAYEAAIDVLEREARRRAFQGVEEAVIGKNGEVVGTTTKFSDTLLIFLMKGARPNKYRDNARVELTGADGGPIQTSTLESLDDHERQRLRALVEGAIAEAEAVG